MSDRTVLKSEEAIAKGSQSFAAAARLFDRQTRNDAVMLYAWCRHCDDVIDGQMLGAGQDEDYRSGQHMRLALLRKQTNAALSGEASGEYIFDALQRVVASHEIPHRYPQELLTGFEMDVANRRYETIEEMLEYCYHVAGVVGVMMAMIMGARDPDVLDRACDLGLAFQLTNIARDVIDDARAGRVYVPGEILTRHGVADVNADDRSQWPRLHRCALELLDIADNYYASARHGIPALGPRSAWAIAAASRVYRAIGAKLRLGGANAWDRRVATTRNEKLAMLALSLGDVAVSRFVTADVPRTGLWQRPV